MRDEVLEFLRQNQGSFVSGQDMSEACHVSRTAIWKHIKALRQKGYKIESYTKRGYRLLEEPDLLSPLAMKQILKTDVFGKRYVYMDTTESTNLEARRLAQQGAEEGTVVVTEEQAAGRGRLSRGWYSPFGKGLWFSLILRPDFPPVEAPKCTLMAAVALTKAFHKMGLTDAGIKWPNDIIIHHKKVSGMLIEKKKIGKNVYFIVGIGLNLLQRNFQNLPKAGSILTQTKKDIVVVPISAIIVKKKSEIDEKTPKEEADKRQEAVFVYKDGKAELRAVTTGIQDNVNIEILSGVAKDEEIITGPYNVISKTLKNNEKVNKLAN